MKKSILSAVAALALVAAPIAASAQVALNGFNISASGPSARAGVALNAIGGSSILNLNTNVRSTGGIASITGALNGTNNLVTSRTGLAGGFVGITQTNPAINVGSRFGAIGTPLNAMTPSVASVRGLNINADVINSGSITTRATGFQANSSIRDVTINANAINGLNFRSTAIGNGNGAVSSISGLRIIGGTGGISGVNISSTAIGNRSVNIINRQ